MPETANSGNRFSALNLSEYMTASLPATSGPHLRDPYDAVALLAHACMIAVDFRLNGLGEEHTIPVSPSSANDSSSSTPPLPREWNQTENSSYAFRYTHNQSALKYLLKVSRLGSKALIVGLTLPDEHKVHSLDVAVKDFLSPSTFPFTAANPAEDIEGAAKAVRERFLSPGRIADLASMVKLQLIQKLAPKLHKEGYEESAHAARRSSHSPPASSSASEDRAPPEMMPPYAQPRPFHDDPLAADLPRRPFPAGDFPPPGFEDEYEITRGPGAGPYGGPRRPLNIGERDLYPPGLGPHDPLRAGPGGGFAPGGGGGMHPTFDDPMFRGGDGGAGGELWGPGGRAPHGARYDPVGPGDGPPRGGLGRFPGGGGGGGGGGMRGPFGGGGGGFGGDII
ncbi:MAG: hypothetical protein Q9191_004712 [Dirinaria sp. TL-2023a]